MEGGSIGSSAEEDSLSEEVEETAEEVKEMKEAENVRDRE